MLSKGEFSTSYPPIAHAPSGTGFCSPKTGLNTGCTMVYKNLANSWGLARGLLNVGF